MPSVELKTTVGQLVVSKPHLARVLEELGIDYCCGGKRPLDEVCHEKGLDPEQVLSRLNATPEPPAPSETDWNSATLSQLADHILDTHHAYMHAELPRLAGLVDKIVAVHGRNHPELIRLRELYDSLRAEIDSHLMKEEQILFPLIKQIEKAGGPVGSHCGSVANPIRVMEHEHDSAGEVLAEMRQLTGGYATPPDGCATYRTTMEGLSRMEADLHQHIHKENNILFPRVVQVEAGSTREPAFDSGRRPTR